MSNIVKKILNRTQYGALFALELCVVIDFLFAYYEWYSISKKLLLFIFLIITSFYTSLAIVLRIKKRNCMVSLFVQPVICTLVLLSVNISYYSYSRENGYQSVADGRSVFFSDKNAMVIVPHQDDELNIAGGIIEQFVSSGSEVFIVYVTNGDCYGRGAVRLQEAIEVACAMNIPEDHIFFLGYGDTWSQEHIYNAEPSVCLTSKCGKTETYGLDGHEAYRKHTYTNCNYLADIESIIVELKPDIIITNDIDSHEDHIAVSLAVEKTIGRILKEYDDYTPAVLKGMAYSTAWYSISDYYSEDGNVASTVNPSAFQYPNYWNSTYDWDNRIRLPIKPEALGLTLEASELFQTMKNYKSQGVTRRADAIINSDKTFWQRYTTSLSYKAVFSTSSGNAETLNDFLILDSEDVNDFYSTDYSANVWHPDEFDDEKRVIIDFDKEYYIDTVSLFDSPSIEDNVLNADLVFPDGTVISSGPLELNGKETVISIQKCTKHFEILLTEMQGSRAGITEIEVYSQSPGDEISIIKIMDEDGCFAYYYRMHDSSQMFYLYTHGVAEDLSNDNYKLICSNPKCSAEIQENVIAVYCPRGETCEVEVRSMDGKYSDCVLFYYPTKYKAMMQKRIETLFHNYEQFIIGKNEVYENTVFKQLVDLLAG